jgi:hypothetical protein
MGVAVGVSGMKQHNWKIFYIDTEISPNGKNLWIDRKNKDNFFWNPRKNMAVAIAIKYPNSPRWISSQKHTIVVVVDTLKMCFKHLMTVLIWENYRKSCPMSKL